MITVTKLTGAQFAINPDLIERIQEMPDTTLNLVDGSSYIVTESLAVVVDRIAAYRARVVALAYTLGATNLSAADADAPDLGAAAEGRR